MHNNSNLHHFRRQRVARLKCMGIAKGFRCLFTTLLGKSQIKWCKAKCHTGDDHGELMHFPVMFELCRIMIICRFARILPSTLLGGTWTGLCRALLRALECRTFACGFIATANPRAFNVADIYDRLKDRLRLRLPPLWCGNLLYPSSSQWRFFYGR